MTEDILLPVLREIQASIAGIDKRMSMIEMRMTQIEHRQAQLESRMSMMEHSIASFRLDHAVINDRIDQLSYRIDELEKR